MLAELQAHGHEVTVLVRDDDQADLVASRGATPLVVDLYDTTALVDVLRSAEGAIHTASPGDATLPTWPTSFDACSKTIRRAATTSLATG